MSKMRRFLLMKDKKYYYLKNGELKELEKSIYDYGFAYGFTMEQLNECSRKNPKLLDGISFKIAMTTIGPAYFNKMWNEFKIELKKNRFLVNPHHLFFQECINFFDRPFIMDKKNIYYRARINETGKEFDNISKELNPPPEELCNSGRLNAKGVRYLYVADVPKTAVSETRPWLGSIVEVAAFKVKLERNLILKDFVPLSDKEKETEIKNVIFDIKQKDKQISEEVAKNSARKQVESENEVRCLISKLFSAPISGNNKELDYLITQCITEYVRDIDKANLNEKYDGIRYKSSAYEHGINYLIFDPVKMEIDKKLGIAQINKCIVDYDDLSYSFPKI